MPPDADGDNYSINALFATSNGRSKKFSTAATLTTGGYPLQIQELLALKPLNETKSMITRPSALSMELRAAGVHPRIPLSKIIVATSFKSVAIVKCSIYRLTRSSSS